MRVGINPEKQTGAKNILKQHRVVVVVYVPKTRHAYFEQMHQVVEQCLQSIISTINNDTTAITVINNDCCNEVNDILNKYRDKIDKLVIYNENKGKVYAVLNEVRGINERFVTITDCDILFFPGWEKAVFSIYRHHPKAGVVSPYPCPYTAFYYNKPAFGFNSIRNNISYAKHVADTDIDLYIKGTNLPKIIERKQKFNWKQKQFILKTPSPAVIGAYHVVSTYRTEQFRNIYTFPKVKFANSYEEEFIDRLAADRGLYRLSTLKTYAYHLGNTFENLEISADNSGMLPRDLIDGIGDYVPIPGWLIKLNTLIGRLFIKFKWNH